VKDDFAVDLLEAFQAMGIAEPGPLSVIDVITANHHLDEAIEQAISSGAARVALEQAVLASPIPNPGKVVCLALNNSANKDRILSGPKHPVLFFKPASCLIGGGQPIVMRPDYGRVHPEPELAAVISQRGRNISPDDAYDYVYGYTIMNDLTSPTMRIDDTLHYRAIHPSANDPEGVRYEESWVSYSGRYKGSDTFGPMGPWIVTRDEIADPHDLVVRCTHQGRVVTEDHSSNLFYKIPEVVSFVSSYMTLFPGDIISLGTALQSAQGGRAVQTIDLNKLGGPIAVTITGIGTLENPVVWQNSI
jgi:2-keto-4-pentenoate hydratase/2-oxohepta-3-ene-1,7-dioic acid hydratase in catechol pathway